MNPAAENRELISLIQGEMLMRGTYHKPRQSGPVGGDGGAGTGILFINPGFLPRAGHADSCVYWADHLAQRGYPCFRFDLPAMGDSDGDPPEKMFDFVNDGGYGPILSAAIQDLAAQFRLSGVVVIALCAGSATALFAAPRCRECVGLILMDPYFFRPEERTRVRTELSRWASLNRLGGMASNIYDRLRHIRLLLHRNRPPKNANLPLIQCWKRVTSAGVPVLVLKAPGFKAPDLKPRRGEFDYLSYLQRLAGRESRTAIQFIEGTNHSFSDATGRAAVLQHTERWLSEYFPINERPCVILTTQNDMVNSPA